MIACEESQTITKEFRHLGIMEYVFMIIHSVLENCTACDLSKNRTNIVYGEGSPNSHIMFVRSHPTEEEDIAGSLYEGDSSKKFVELLKEVGFDTALTYTTFANKCHATRKKGPLPKEIFECKEFLFREMEFIKPHLIVALGKQAIRSVLDKTYPSEHIDKHRQKILKTPTNPSTVRFNLLPTDVIVSYDTLMVYLHIQVREKVKEDLQFARTHYLKQMVNEL